MDKLYKLLDGHEGRKRKMYKCSAGYNTIGVGHNLDANPISDRAIQVILEDDVADVIAQLDAQLPWWRDNDEVRQAALIDLCFNLGIGTLRTFRNTLAAWQAGDFDAAAIGLENSKWYSQVGRRGPRVVSMVRNGTWPEDVA
jgi:lysozyme